MDLAHSVEFSNIIIAYSIWSNLTSYVSFLFILSRGEKELCGWVHIDFYAVKLRTESNGQSKYWADTVKH